MAILGDTKAVSLSLLDGIIGNLNPKTTGTYDLGTSSLKWNNVYATTFNGNATSATKATQDGNGATISSTYLKLSGGTLTGVLTAKGSMYEDSYSGALNMANSNIYGVNSIYTADSSDNAAEGIHFYRDSTHVDTLWMSGGDILFVPNRALGTSTTKANSQKVGRFTANPTTDQVVVADGTTGGIKTTGYTIAKSVPSNALFTDTWNALSTSQAGYVAQAPNDTGKFLRGDATWAAVTASNVGLGNVENTKLSTWAGSSNITTLGTISTGTIPWARLSNIPSNFTPASHSHGNIANGGTITSTTVALANGDMLLFSDSSNSGKIERSSITIGTGTSTYLRNDGTWATPTNTWNALSTSQAGYVAKAPNDTTKFLRGDATWATLPVASTDAAGIIKIGTTASDAAAGNHSHSISLSATGTATINLAHDTTYTLTAGGNSVVFKMPAEGSISFPSKTLFQDSDALLVCTAPGTTFEQYNYVKGTLANPLSFQPSTSGTENKLLSQKGTWETIGAWAKSTNKPTYTSSEITKAVIGNGRVFYGTCNSTASTAEKAVTCSSFVSDDLVAGTMIMVKFSITNTASVSSLTLNVNSTTAKSIRYIYNGSYSTIPGAGYLKENQIYKFIYDGTYWIVEMSYNTNTNTLLRTYSSSTNIEVPLIAQSSASSTTAAWTSYTDTSKDWYGVIPNTDSLRAKINLSTGHITIPGGITSVTPTTGNNSTLVATTAFVNTAITNAIGAAIGGSY